MGWKYSGRKVNFYIVRCDKCNCILDDHMGEFAREHGIKGLLKIYQEKMALCGLVPESGESGSVRA